MTKDEQAAPFNEPDRNIYPSYIHAMGGEPHISASFPDGNVVINQLQ